MENSTTIASEILGFGLTRDTAQCISIDQSASPVWVGEHVFARPVIFSSKQSIHLSSISDAQDEGALVTTIEGVWSRLPIGSAGEVLTIAGGKPTWGSIDLSVAKGVLPAVCGGTGLRLVSTGDMLVGATGGAWKALRLGVLGQTLTMTTDGPGWADSVGVSGSGKEFSLACWNKSGRMGDTPIFYEQDELARDILVFDSLSPILQFRSGRAGGIALSHEGQILVLGINDDAIGSCNNELLGGAIKLDTRPDYSAQYFRITTRNPTLEETTIVAFNTEGTLTKGTIPFDRVLGTFSVAQGGTGLAALQRGDLIFASSGSTFSRLSADGADGLYLKMVGGLPTWSAGGPGGGKQAGMLSLGKGTTSSAPLLFQPGELHGAPVGGMMEWDGNTLYFTPQGNLRRRVAYQDSDITGHAAGVTGIVSLANGGLGRDLSLGLLPGNLLYVQPDSSLGWLNPGNKNQALCSSEDGMAPCWSNVLHTVVAVNSGGIKVDNSNPFCPALSIDITTTLAWSAPQSFPSVSTESISVSQAKFQPRSDQPGVLDGEMWWDGDHLYFRRLGSTVNLTGADKPTQSHVIRLGEELSPRQGEKRRVRIPLPYASDGITPVRWNFRRLDWRAEQSPDTQASMQIWLNDNPILSPPLMLGQGQNSCFASQFAIGAGMSGELLQVEFCESGDSDAWSIYLQVESN